MSVDALFNGQLDSLSAVSLYAQLTARIKGLIRSGELAYGDLLPSELEFCERLGISRSTVRQSFAQLETEGYVVRRRGKGTYVSIPKLKHTVSGLCSFTHQMQREGIACRSRLIEFEVVSGAEALLPAQAYRITRLRETAGEPFMLDTVFVPVAIAPALTREALAERSLYDVIEEQTGNIPQFANESYEVVRLDKAQAGLLQTDCLAAFRVHRVSRMASGELFEKATMLMRGDKCRLEASLLSDAVAFSRTLQV